VKSTAVISFTREGLDDVAPALLRIAEAEGLDGHGRALRIRMEDR
jgi:histidinol dehydrogenase